MSSTIGRRRFLTNFEHHRLPHLFTDTLVIGSGVAGLRAALGAAEGGDVLLVTKAQLDDSSTSWAQGGVAAAISPDDSPTAHAMDTLDVGCDLCHEAVVKEIVGEAPQRIAELRHWGAAFDGPTERPARGREGGHSTARILYANGDATGAEFSRALIAQVRTHPRIRIFEHCFTIDLLTESGRVVGVVTFHAKYRHQMFWATTTIVATGGCGRVFRETTNPPVATGDGLAMALRAGAALRDMEMVQFHPTTLYVAGATRALVSEAVRGEGAKLCHRDGEPFMPRYDERGELAPRDVVSRAISAEMRARHLPNVYLDVRHFQPGFFEQRFPTIFATCLSVGIDPQTELIPVRPTAHYTIGGVVADSDGRTSLPGLLVAGEAASIGLHGANRLASNSLLEGLVVGARTGNVAAEAAAATSRINSPIALSHLLPASSRTELDIADVLHSLRSVMSRNVGVERSTDRLQETLEIISFWARYTMDKVFDDPDAWAVQNQITLAYCITLAASTRQESRGAHFLTDRPATDPQWRVHVDVARREDALYASTTPVT